MEIPLATLSRLEAGGSYYLSNTTGTIKRTGLWQWFKCVTGLGDGRAKAQRLAQAVKESLLASAGIANDDALSAEIRQFDNASYSLSGATLRDIANRFRAKHSAAIEATSLRRSASAIAEEVADAKISEWIKGRRVSNDPLKPESLGYVRKLALYSVQHIVESVAADGSLLDDRERLASRMESAMRKAIESVNALEIMQTNSRRAGYPLSRASGGPAQLAIPRFEFDELHFRVVLAALITKDGPAGMRDFMQRIGIFQEEIVQERREAFLNVHLEPPGTPMSGFIFAESALKAFKAMENSEWHRQA